MPTMTSVAAAVLAVSAGLGSGGVAAPQLRAVSPFNAIADQFTTTAGTRFSYVFRQQVIIGSGDVNGLVIGLSNAAQQTTSVVLGGSSYTVDAAALERVSIAATTPITWSASRTPTIAAGSHKVLSDTVFPAAFGLAKFTVGEIYFIKIGITLSGVGQNFASVTVQGVITGQQAIVYDKAAGTMTSVDATGTFGVGSGSPAFGGAGAQLPLIVLGYFISGDPATFAGAGDSIFRGQGDSAAIKGQGMFMRTMFDSDLVSNPKGCILIAKSGGTAGTWSTGNVSYLTEWLQYCRYGWEEYGTNSFVTADSVAIWALMRTAGCQKILRNYLICRSSSTDNWATLVNQIANTFIAPFNAFLTTQLGLGTGVDILIDPIGVYDSVSTALFAVNGTAFFMTPDGIHPSSTGHDLVSTQMRTARAGL